MGVGLTVLGRRIEISRVVFFRFMWKVRRMLISMFDRGIFIGCGVFMIGVWGWLLV